MTNEEKILEMLVDLRADVRLMQASIEEIRKKIDGDKQEEEIREEAREAIAEFKKGK